MEHKQYLIEDMPYNEVEDILDNSFGVKVELLENYSETRNRVVIRFVGLNVLYDALEELYNNGASYEEI